MLVHQELVAKHPTAWLKDGRSQEADKALAKAKAILELVMSGIRDQESQVHEAYVLSKDASVVLKEKSTNETKKLVRFSDGKERYSWPDLLKVTKLTKEEIMARVMAYDEQPCIARSRQTALALMRNQTKFHTAVGCCGDDTSHRLWVVDCAGVYYSESASSSARIYGQKAFWKWCAKSLSDVLRKPSLQCVGCLFVKGASHDKEALSLKG
eukprot:2726999-Amphidinium_carterae.1